MAIATPKDREALYWSKQAALLQDHDNGIQPEDGQIVIDANYTKALGLYRAGKAEEAVGAFKTIVAAKLSQQGIGGENPKPITVADLSKLVSQDDILNGSYDKHYNGKKVVREGGWNRVKRIGWTREGLQKLFGATKTKPAFVVHYLGHGNFADTIGMMIKANGALLSTVQKPLLGINKNGGSPGDDIPSGGAVNIFACFRVGYLGKEYLYFDISLALRSDVQVHGSSDNYGNPGYKDEMGASGFTRFTNPLSWKKHAPSLSSTEVSYGSHFQVNCKHDIDLREYLYTAAFSTDADVQKIRALAAAQWGANVTFAQGRTLEQVFTLIGKEIP